MCVCRQQRRRNEPNQTTVTKPRNIRFMEIWILSPLAWVSSRLVSSHRLSWGTVPIACSRSMIPLCSTYKLYAKWRRGELTPTPEYVDYFVCRFPFSIPSLGCLGGWSFVGSLLDSLLGRSGLLLNPPSGGACGLKFSQNTSNRLKGYLRLTSAREGGVR